MLVAGFRNWANQLSREVIVGGKTYTVYIVPVKVFFTPLVNDPQYLPQDREYAMRNHVGARRANVYFGETAVRDMLQEHANYAYYKCARISRFFLGNEMFIDNSEEYMFR